MDNFIALQHQHCNENDYQYRSIQGWGMSSVVKIVVATLPLKKEKMNYVAQKRGNFNTNKINNLQNRFMGDCGASIAIYYGAPLKEKTLPILA